MLFRVCRIFQRYADENLRLEGQPPADARFGRIDRLHVARNRLIVEGWTDAPRIGLRLDRATAWTTPDLAGAGHGLAGFTLDLPFTPGTPELLVPQGGQDHALPLPGISAMRVRLARARLWLPYLATLIRLVPQIRRWKLQGDLGAREVIKERLGLVPMSLASEMDPAILAPPPGDTASGMTATVILPVYNAFDILPEVLARAEDGADLALRFIVIEDASPDPQIRPFLRAWAADPARRCPVTLLENAENLGFIRSVNRGFDAARAWPADPVVLLNADAFLPQGWTTRLLRPLADPSVASVTPMSNDAEIFNVPAICRRQDLPPGLADRLDAAARDLNAVAGQQVEAPTGVGFCMAIGPAWLARLPAFDTIFGKGYGEETDWCQKARALGGRHVAAVDLFVEHRGGSSFGSEAKRRLLEQNGAEISRRYPGYDREVQAFIRNDPLATARLALGLSWAAQMRPDPVPVWLAHAMGGGAENDLQRRIAAEIASHGPVVVLRVGQGHRWKLELHSAEGITQGMCNDIGLIRRLLARLPRRRILYSCGVGDRDPLALPGILLDLAGRGSDPLPGGPQPIGVMVHDFFPVSPAYTLLGKDGVWHGIPLPGTPAGADPAHATERPGGVPVSLAAWQAAWGQLIAAAEDITTFSDSSRAIMAAVWPDAAPRIRVVPHALLAQIPRITAAAARDGRRVIGVLGNIGLHKGAAVVQQLAQDLDRAADAGLGLVIIGQFDPAFRLPKSARIHGSYEWRDLPGLVERYGIGGWLVPSVWPETFSFTIHEAIATGMPVFAFDLGAQGDALRRALAAGAPGALLPLTGTLPAAALRAGLP